ncbi:DNA-3-methyladenine glycosylase [Nocardioides jensenii]|uniref:DNA-3-methyladenine glycosylase n=1 Tax=Nocardioides jensenii TaxID=1843 RepID=UPI00082F4A9C|nr:DNA-3-methyladenine glycosylase [Nocardioides jensenii]
MTGLDVLAGPPVDVAPLLLGAVLSHAGVSLRLTEVEAYDGADDPGSHAYRGPTKRNQVMFGSPGHLYCYFTYGMHVCCNVVCREEGRAGAVLLRAGEVIDGIETARSRRPKSSDRDLARGPARLCRALGIALDDDGADLSSGPIRLSMPTTAPANGGGGTREISTGPRVGLRQAPDWAWRFWLSGEPTVSAYRPAKPR